MTTPIFREVPALEIKVQMNRRMALWNAICLGADMAGGIEREDFVLDILDWWQDQGMPMPKRYER